MTLPTRKTLLLNAACLLVLGWLYGGDLLDALRARSAEVSAFLAPPSRGWPALVLVATLGALGVGLRGALTGQGEGYKGYRLLPILLVCALFFDLVLAEGKVPLPPEDVAMLGLRQVRDKAQALANGRSVPSDPAQLRPLVEGMGQPPYLVRGERARAWTLQVRSGCQGPVQEAPGLEVGTFIYCVSPDRSQAWVTLVALPWGKRFGVPTIFSAEGEPYVMLVQPPPEPPPAVSPPSPGEEEPAAPDPFMLPPDAGVGAPAPTP